MLAKAQLLTWKRCVVHKLQYNGLHCFCVSFEPQPGFHNAFYFLPLYHTAVIAIYLKSVPVASIYLKSVPLTSIYLKSVPLTSAK